MPSSSTTAWMVTASTLLGMLRETCSAAPAARGPLVKAVPR
jgi:hypothetical protein